MNQDFSAGQNGLASPPNGNQTQFNLGRAEAQHQADLAAMAQRNHEASMSWLKSSNTSSASTTGAFGSSSSSVHSSEGYEIDWGFARQYFLRGIVLPVLLLGLAAVIEIVVQNGGIERTISEIASNFR